MRSSRPTLTGDRPQVVAHRGASGTRPEHTRAAYELAIEQGADAVECDVRLTADGRLVCLHDRRIDRTSNGEGSVSMMTLAQLRTYDFGAWKSHPEAEILTLEELLDLLADAPRPVGLAVETKHPNKFRGLVETELARMLGERGLGAGDPATTPVRVMSFSVLALRRISDLLPGVDRVLLSEVGLDPMLRVGRLPDDIPACGISTTLLRRDPGIVERQHANGNAVHAYTVDAAADIERCLDTGVDAIITNHPAVVREAVLAVWDSRGRER